MSHGFLARTLCELLVGLGCCPGLIQAQDQTPASPVQWRTDYKQARREALDKKLPIFIYFHTIPNPYCVMFDRDFFADPKVAKLLNEHFIALKLNGAVDPGRELANRLFVSAWPTLILASHDGKILPATMGGYREPTKLYEHLKRIRAIHSAWLLASKAQNPLESVLEYYNQTELFPSLDRCCEDIRKSVSELPDRRVIMFSVSVLAGPNTAILVNSYLRAQKNKPRNDEVR